MTAKVISRLIITQIFQRLPNKVKFMISTCKCYITLHLSMHRLPDWIMILMKTWPPLKPSALPACPVIENSCPKPSGFVNFQLALNLILTMGDLFSFIIDLEVNILVAILLRMGWQNSRIVYSIDGLPLFFFS